MTFTNQKRNIAEERQTHINPTCFLLPPLLMYTAPAMSPTRGTISESSTPPIQSPALASERPADCPVADRVCAEILSLPLYPSLPADAITRVADAVAAQ